MMEEKGTEAARELPESVAALERLSRNYWWSWAADGAEVFRDLDPQLWDECEQSPRCLLSEVSDVRLTRKATDPVYVGRVRRLAEKFDRYMAASEETWARRGAPQITREHPVAYFCAEFGIHNSLPLYSGGLGVLAGDHLKSASDLGVPLVAVGLFYNYGYFRQRLRRDGWQEEKYSKTDPTRLPIALARDPETGEPIKFTLEIRGREVRVRSWVVRVGRVKLYLLDTNLDENTETDRYITGHLYGGDRETRCVQEIVLGVGGVRLLRSLGVDPSVFHLNEGHSAFLTLELARELIAGGATFADAAPRVRERCVFTTHTPVAAGHDEFTPQLVEHCFGRGFIESLRMDAREFINLGRVVPDDEAELFGLTPLALKMCRSTNGVSRKHGEVSRELWLKAYPGRPADEVPITSVTNGVHAPTWVAPLVRELYERHVGEDWGERVCDAEAWGRAVARMPDEELWRAHMLLKRRLIAFVRDRVFQTRLRRGDIERAEHARTLFDADVLTIGFARRVAAYKRWSLILTDMERLLRIIANEERPVQLIFAGKAHPHDETAKEILQRIAQWKFHPLVTRRAVFIQDYDHEVARQLVQSVDVWMNVPRRPLEASGTSGEKVAMNGGLNLSVLDGWWLEGCDGRNGWAVGGEHLLPSEAGEDASDAEALYRTLEEDVVPAYYERDERGIPTLWVAMMKHAIETLVPRFNSDRMVREYVKRIYLK
ncbi:MAG: alpha-glucan family phosphorylase [Acidobacteriota bacterium]|nr:alpha-glucan family phosphorylase [Acidobacteriota bacterium]